MSVGNVGPALANIRPAPRACVGLESILQHNSRIERQEDDHSNTRGSWRGEVRDPCRKSETVTIF